MTGRKAIRLGRGQRMHCGNNTMHTHAHVELQSGAEISATAKPEKNNKNESGVARSDIWCLATSRLVGNWEYCGHQE